MRFSAIGGLVVGLLLVQSVRADTIIDTFGDEVPGTWPTSANAGTPFVATNEPGLAGVIGGVRGGTVSHMAGPLDITAAVLTGPGIYSLSSDALTDGSSTLSYDAGGAGLNLDLLDPHGTGPVNLSEAAFIMDVVGTDLGGVPFDVTMDGVTVSSNANVGQAVIPLDQFLGLDVSDIDSIEVAFDPPQEFDITVDFIGFDWPDVQVTPTPEPASILAWLVVIGVGLVATKRTGRRQRETN